MARPLDLTAEIADEICARLSDARSLRSICLDDDMPSQTTVFKWLRTHPDFAQQYARAREAQADAIFDEALDIADDGTNDWMERLDQDGQPIGWQLNGEHVQRSKLRIETRKWMAGKLRPKVYGDKLELSGDPDRPVVTKIVREIVDPAHPNG